MHSALVALSASANIINSPEACNIPTFTASPLPPLQGLLMTFKLTFLSLPISRAVLILYFSYVLSVLPSSTTMISKGFSICLRKLM